ncbi:hypothetical protein KBI52_11005 [Microvirga sp. HBU67558]|uniref:hypothetical protein n=1 Tax=Microvirga sp. HBU67558 TaxID=2824562 RepID=UPI001B3652F0|nr:hypothetical protein [Microvirga sp. HBU67558]MBQ0820734.1 hypothetical protein [Microvirga sp. HBU67558]
MMRPSTLILATLLLGSPVMARDTNYEYAPPMQGETEAERLMNSPRGQELKGVVDLMMKGDREGAEQALQEYRKKYNQAPSGSSPAAGAQPRQPYNFGPPMMLPPEAR